MTEDQDFMTMPKDEFARRFTAELNSLAGMPPPEEQEAANNYAQQAGEAAWDEAGQRADGPEECARTDYSYWEE